MSSIKQQKANNPAEHKDSGDGAREQQYEQARVRQSPNEVQIPGPFPNAAGVMTGSPGVMSPQMPLGNNGAGLSPGMHRPGSAGHYRTQSPLVPPQPQAFPSFSKEAHPFLLSEQESPYQNYSAATAGVALGTPGSAANIHQQFGAFGQFGTVNQGFGFGRQGSSSNSSHSSGSASLSRKRPAPTVSKKRKRFTNEEDNMILESVNKRKHPKTNHVDWDRVVEDCELLQRTKEQIRSRYARIKKKEGLNIQTNSSSSTSSSRTPRQSSISPALFMPDAKRFKSDPNADTSLSFITSSANDNSGGSFSNLSESNQTKPKRRSRTRRKATGMQTDSARDYIGQLKEELEQTKKYLRETLATNKEQKRRLDNQSEELKQAQQEFMIQRERYPRALLTYLRKSAEHERQLAAKKLRDDCERLGSISPRINGINVQEQWTPGEAFVKLQQEQRELESQKSLIEHKRKVIQKLRSNLRKGRNETDEDHMFELSEQETVYKLRLNEIKKEEQTLNNKLKQLEVEKRSHIKEIKRQRDEERSRFNHFPTIGPDNRYFLIKLIGRGGFSEVYKAYDLKELRVVACKIHQLNSSWKDTRKENYIKHVLRECQIHKKISHPRVVQMYDTFIYDENTYVTVLEYCSGYDLDMFLKKSTMTEKKAHNIISQVFSGLKYLSESPRKIIHFDLKPANILYCNGEIKITDFGLSKMMEEEDAIELTSQGAGTYWYLPPECFEVHNTPKISSKVDVWSAGVIFYQMLFGRKPFGNDLSQREVLHQRVISNAKIVDFPQKPAISQDAKEFIRLCLTYDQEDRPDVAQIYTHKYLRTTPKK